MQLSQLTSYSGPIADTMKHAENPQINKNKKKEIFVVVGAILKWTAIMFVLTAEDAIIAIHVYRTL